MKINVLTNNSCPNSRAFNCPLLAADRQLRQRGIHLKFTYQLTDKRLLDADTLFINSNVFRPFWRSKTAEIFRFLESAAKRKLRILWFDTTDSTWVTQFPVMPYVDLFLKSQILVDHEKYLKNFKTGRIYTDVFNALYKAGEEPIDFCCPADNEAELKKKLRISWNTCFENYTERRLGLVGKIAHRLRPYLNISHRINIHFTPPSNSRDIDISCRLGTTYDRPSVTAHRKAVIAIMRETGVSCGKIPLAEYFAEMRAAKIGIGPFGIGEITLRDFEIIICGCALVKPDMSHMTTWPELFIPGKTFVPHKWDLSDLRETVINLLADHERRRAIAEAGQDAYRKAVSPEGMELFADRIASRLAEVAG